MLYFLNEASDALFSSLTLEDELIFDKISDLIVPQLADWFAIEILDKDTQKLNLLTVAHNDPARLKIGLEFRERYPYDTMGDSGVAAVLKNGTPVLYEELTDELLKSGAKDEEHFRMLKALNFLSVIIAPLKSRNNTFGIITFVSSRESGKLYNQEDLNLIGNFANKVAIVIDNSRLYKTAQAEVAKSKRIETEILRLLEETKFKEEWLDGLIRTTPGIVWETKLNRADNSQKMTFVSKYAEEMLGYTREQLLSVDFWWSIIHPEDMKNVAANTEETLRKGAGHNQYRMIAKDGRVVWTEARSQILYDEEGNARGIRGVTFDITRMKELENRKDEFIGIASHELKTPITSAKLIVQILNKYATDLPEDHQYFIKKLDDQLDKLTLLINSMLDVNRLHEAGIPFYDEPFDLNQLVRELCDDLKIVNRNRIAIDGKIDGKLTADRERVSQVISNLLTNAIKYSEKGAPIRIVLGSSPDGVSISVKDEGVGIQEQYRDKIFERFFRVPDPQIKFTSGLGLGLNIAHQIVAHYKGKIWAESKPGKGSVFHVSLPPNLLQKA